MAVNNLPEISGVVGKKVYIGLSGGVDSALSAAILKQNGAEVTGIYMKNWAGERGLQLDCPWKEDMESAQVVAKHLEIDFASVNFEEEYKKHVLDYFFTEYEKGRTPNPDILCNSEIKFKAFLNRAIAEGADLIATGHYVGKRDGQLIMGKDKNKDQSYFLSNLTKDQLYMSIFPLQDLTKPEVREFAQQLNLPNAGRKDSQGICFIGELDVQEFLRKYLPTKPGEIVDIDTDEVVGQHDGMAFLTIGQRQGIGIGGLDKPYYVVNKDPKANKVLVAMGKDNPALFAQEVCFEGLHWIDQVPGETIRKDMLASIRYRQKPEAGELNIEKKNFIFKEPQRAVAPGQSIVFYQKDICLGRGVII